jgi:glycosyltransferase involved in cell wall biosynthesis
MADAIWCNSRSTLDQVAELGVRPEVAAVIHPGFRRALGPLVRNEADASSSSRPLRLLTVGNIVARKAQDVLVEACSILRERGRLFSLVLAGDSTVETEYASRVREMIEELSLSDSVILAGHLQEKELEKAYAGADLLVHPARWEAFGIAVAEGMSYGLPVVGSRIGGIPELVSDGQNGLLVPPGDELALADAIDSFILDRALLREMGEKSKMKADLLNDWEQTCRAFHSFVAGIAGWSDCADSTPHLPGRGVG